MTQSAQMLSFNTLERLSLVQFDGYLMNETYGKQKS